MKSTDKADEAYRILAGVVREYLDWGAMTGSDRDFFCQRFTALLAGEPDPYPIEPDKEKP